MWGLLWQSSWSFVVAGNTFLVPSSSMVKFCVFSSRLLFSCSNFLANCKARLDLRSSDAFSTLNWAVYKQSHSMYLSSVPIWVQIVSNNIRSIAPQNHGTMKLYQPIGIQKFLCSFQMDTDLLKKGKRSYQDLKLVQTILSPLSWPLCWCTIGQHSSHHSGQTKINLLAEQWGDRTQKGIFQSMSKSALTKNKLLEMSKYVTCWGLQLPFLTFQSWKACSCPDFTAYLWDCRENFTRNLHFKAMTVMSVLTKPKQIWKSAVI